MVRVSFSDALRHIVEWKVSMTMFIQPVLTNYFDDFLFLAINAILCNGQVRVFLQICATIDCPISMEKTEWASQLLTFLGILLNGKMLTLSILLEKKFKTTQLLNLAIQKKKVTVKFVQQITGVLNFINKAIVPGRAFTRAMYHKLTLKDKKGRLLKQHHHVYLNNEFILDCRVWLAFLSQCDNVRLCRQFIDFYGTSEEQRYQLMDFHSDASKNKSLGMGVVFSNHWIFGLWPKNFIEKYNPSIEFLELYVLNAAILAWEDHWILINRRVIIFCDNEAVVFMINQSGSTCQQCMKLIRILTLNNIKFNRQIRVVHVRSERNVLADALSRNDFVRFWRNAPKLMSPTVSQIPSWFWPIDKIWCNNKGNYLANMF